MIVKHFKHNLNVICRKCCANARRADGALQPLPAGAPHQVNHQDQIQVKIRLKNHTSRQNEKEANFLSELNTMLRVGRNFSNSVGNSLLSRFQDFVYFEIFLSGNSTFLSHTVPHFPCAIISFCFSRPRCCHCEAPKWRNGATDSLPFVKIR